MSTGVKASICEGMWCSSVEVHVFKGSIDAETHM